MRKSPASRFCDRLRSFGAVTAALLAASAFTAKAADLFEVAGVTTDTFPPISFDYGAKSLPNLVSDLINGTGNFNGLQTREFVAGLRYGGVHDALQFNVQQVGPNWVAQLTTPFKPGLIARTFNGPTRAAVEDQIDEYLKKEGSGDLAKFLAEINKASVAGSTDGNPSAATAQSAAYFFGEYGLRPTETEEEAVDVAGASRTGFSMTAEAGTFKSQGLEGQNYNWTPMLPIALGVARRVRLEVAMPLSYTQIEGANIFGVGLQVGLPILIIKRAKDQPWLWQLTPHTGISINGSADLISGGALVSGGLTSYLSYRWNKWEFSMGNHISAHESLEVGIGDYSFDPKVSQQIAKNGLKIGRAIGQRWYADVYGIDTEFVADAFTQRYTTVGGGVGYRGPKKKGYAMIGAFGHIAKDYTSANIQFGTGWKF